MVDRISCDGYGRNLEFYRYLYDFRSLIGERKLKISMKSRLGYTFAPAILITPLGALSVIIG
jgi:hypothetical protein